MDKILTDEQKHKLINYVKEDYYCMLAAMADHAAEECGIDFGEGHNDDCDDDTCIHMQVRTFLDAAMGEIIQDGFMKLTRIYGDDYIEIVK